MLVGIGLSGSTHKVIWFDSSDQVWNGSSFVTWSDGSYSSYLQTATEQGTSGRFTATAPSGAARFILRRIVSGLSTDITVWEDSVYIDAALSTISTNVSTLLTRIPAALFSGITSLAEWLGLIAGKQTGNSTARTELRATGAGSGTFDETTDSQEAIRDRGDAAWVTGSGGGDATSANQQTIIDLIQSKNRG